MCHSDSISAPNSSVTKNGIREKQKRIETMTVPHLPNIDLFLPSLPMLGFSLKPWFGTFGCSVEDLQIFMLDVVV